jgi:hypothetical protein
LCILLVYIDKVRVLLITFSLLEQCEFPLVAVTTIVDFL